MEVSDPPGEVAAAPVAAPSGASRRGRPADLAAALIVGVAFLMETLDSTVITASLPAMAATFGIKPLQLNLAVTSYVLSLAVFIPASGWVADRFGARRVFAGAIAVFVAASVLCGLSESLDALVAARVLQGLGGAMMTPVGRLILLRSYLRRDLVAAISYMSIPVVVGPLLGPLVGGLLTTYASWRWIFLLNVPIGLLGLVLTWRYIKPIAPVAPDRLRRFDAVGFALVGLALALLQAAIEQLVHPVLPAPAAYAVLATAAALLALYGLHARGRTAPALDLSLFRFRAFRIGSLSGGFARVGLNAVPFLLQMQLQLGFGYSPIQASFLVFISAVGALTMKPLTATLLRTIGFRQLLIANAVASAVLVAGFSRFTAATPAALMCGYIFVYGISRTLMFNTLQSLTFSEIPNERQSAAVGLAGVVQQLTMSLGVSLSAGAVSFVAGHATVPSADDFAQIFVVMAAVPLVALVGFVGLRPHDGAEAAGYQRAPAGE